MKSVRVLSIGAAVLLGAVLLFAQGMHGHGGPMSFDHLLSYYTDVLDLSSAQQDQMKAIWAKEKPTIEPLIQQMRQNHQAMRALESSGAFDEAKVRAQATQNAQTMVELEVQHARIKAEMMQVLTADQKAKLQKVEASHQGHMHMKDHMGPPMED